MSEDEERKEEKERRKRKEENELDRGKERKEERNGMCVTRLNMDGMHRNENKDLIKKRERERERERESRQNGGLSQWTSNTRRKSSYCNLDENSE